MGVHPQSNIDRVRIVQVEFEWHVRTLVTTFNPAVPITVLVVVIVVVVTASQ